MKYFGRKIQLNPVVSCLTVVVLVCFFVFVFLWVWPLITTSPREQVQQSVAKELGVEIGDYPYPYSFPASYFRTLLKPGMSISEVHSIVRGYDKALRCGAHGEIYYYLNEGSEVSVSVWILYDTHGKFHEIRGESDSGGPITDECSPGLQEE